MIMMLVLFDGAPRWKIKMTFCERQEMESKGGKTNREGGC